MIAASRRWRVSWLAAGLAVSASCALAEESSLPPDVAEFVARRDICDHFGEEIGYGDAQRRAFVARQSRRFCVGTDASLARLRAKYAGDPAVSQRLAAYETCIEASSRCK